MADRYQDRPFPSDDDYGRDEDQHTSPKGEGDPLAELARLIGQTDPFAGMGRANQRANPAAQSQAAHDHYSPPSYAPPEEAIEDSVPSGPPPWMQRASRQQETPPQDFPSAVHPLQRRALQQAAPEPQYDQAGLFAEQNEPHDPSRYDEALYGHLDSSAQEQPHDPAYADEPYAYQENYDEGAEEPVRKRGGMFTVAVVLALAVLGTGAAFAYRSFVGSPRSGEPPIIRADAGPTKVVPTPADGSSKLPDRMVTGDGAEKIVPREEAPVDVNAKAGPRVVFPPLNANNNPPSMASVTTTAPPPANAGNGTMPNSEPRKIKTLSVRGEQPDPSAVPVASAAPAPVARPAPSPKVSSANASVANAPLSLSPQATPAAPATAAEPPRARVANNAPVQLAPAGASSGGTGGYVVQVSSQRNEADAHASFRALQGKFPSVLGSRSPLIKRADLGDKGVYYRAMVGPFGSPDEASQFCGSLKTAGGQCVVQRN